MLGMGGISIWQLLLLTMLFSVVFGALRIRTRWPKRFYGGKTGKARRDPGSTPPDTGTHLRDTRKSVSEFLLETVFGQLTLSVLGGVIASMIFAFMAH